MSAKLVHADDAIRIYEGKAEDWDGGEHIDLVFTNPYGYMPESLQHAPSIFHQWAHRLVELQEWTRCRDLKLCGRWNSAREAFWSANMPPLTFNVSKFHPEPGGWYPEGMVRWILNTIEPRQRPRTIFDGFMGRGTTAKIARELGMKFVGVEELPAHIAIAKDYLGLAQ